MPARLRDRLHRQSSLKTLLPGKNLTVRFFTAC